MKCAETDISGEQERLGWVRLGQVMFSWVGDAHAQGIMGTGVVIIPPHDFWQS
jgi:hypothetical protein